MDSDRLEKGARMEASYAWYLGIDWGGDEHHLCLLAADGREVATRRIPHTAPAVQEAVAWVRQHTGAIPEEIAVAIETPRGALVDTLIEQGFAVFAVNPKQLDRLREGLSAGAAKDDPRDAYGAAQALRTYPRVFRQVRVDDPVLIQLREASRLLEDLQHDETRLANRLREQLYRVHAAWLQLNPAANEPWLWSMLAAVPHPDAWRTLGKRRVTAVLRTHRIRRFTSDDVVPLLRQATLSVAPGVADAVAIRIAALVPQLQLLAEQRTGLERQMDGLLDRLAEPDPDAEPHEHRDAKILRSLPGVGRMVCATMLAEATHSLTERDYSTLRAYTGVAPVTKKSGKRLHVVQMRYACKPRLRQALYHWARTSVQHDPATRRYYEALRARGHHYARALRSVADRWLRILVAMLRTRTLYDPQRFSAAAVDA